MHVARHLVKERLRAAGSESDQLAGELELDRERDKVLLHAVVQVTLDRATVGIGGQNEPRPRRAQLGDLGAQPLELVARCFSLLGLQGYRPPGSGLSRLSVAAPRDVK